MVLRFEALRPEKRRPALRRRRSKGFGSFQAPRPRLAEQAPTRIRGQCRLSRTDRTGGGLWLGEAVATFGLVVVIFGVVRSGRAGHVAYAVGGYITAAYWFTSSTSFANPAITLGRTLSDTFAGIAPGSVPMFVLMQLVGAALAVGAVLVLYPDARQVADDVAHPDRPREETRP